MFYMERLPPFKEKKSDATQIPWILQIWNVAAIERISNMFKEIRRGGEFYFKT